MTTMILVLSGLGFIALNIALNLAASELFEWGRHWAEQVVRRVATRWPAAQRDRWQEEWLAELEHLPGMSRRLWFAASLWFGRTPTPAVDEGPTKITLVVETVAGAAFVSALLTDTVRVTDTASATLSDAAEGR